MVLGFSMVKESACQCRRCVLLLGSGRSLNRNTAHSSGFLAWEIPWTEESLVGYSPWGHKELNMAWTWLSN